MVTRVHPPEFLPIESCVLPGTSFQVEGHSWHSAVIQSVTRFGVEMQVNRSVLHPTLTELETNLLALDALGVRISDSAHLLRLSQEAAVLSRSRLLNVLTTPEKRQLGTMVNGAFLNGVLSMSDVKPVHLPVRRYGYPLVAIIRGVAQGQAAADILADIQRYDPTPELDSVEILRQQVSDFCEWAGVVSSTGLVHYGYAVGILKVPARRTQEAQATTQ